MATCSHMLSMLGRAPFLLALATAQLACTQVAEPAPETPKALVAEGAPVRFSYATLDGQTLSTSSVAGRYTVLAFVTTYDHFSHAQARFLSTVVNRHVPRINAGMIVLEPPENRVLVEAFVKVVAPPYPVALADDATIRGQGPFEGLNEVPSIVILDQLGREVWRHKGLASNEMIDAALKAVRDGRTP
jgi:hypothetical protein